MQASGFSPRENAKSYAVVIIRACGRSSIPEASVMESIGRSVLDTRFRGYDDGGCGVSAIDVMQ
jgi:hypothetical protein